jgi:hypothetical protein
VRLPALGFESVNPSLPENIMEHQLPVSAHRMHPLMMAAAASVVLVSLLGAAALTGLLPSSHSTPAPAGAQTATALMTSDVSQSVTPVSASRFITADGRILEEVPRATLPTRSDKVATAKIADSEREVVVHRKPVRHVVHHHSQVALNDTAPRYEPPVNQVAQASPQPLYEPQQQAVYQSQQQAASVFGNVNPVQTGVGAVIGGLLGSQVGKGNGRTLATVAGVIAGGYAGNEISHGRSPVPSW